MYHISSAELRELRMTKLLILKEQNWFGQTLLSVWQLAPGLIPFVNWLIRMATSDK